MPGLPGNGGRPWKFTPLLVPVLWAGLVLAAPAEPPRGPDQLDPAAIPKEERSDDQPPELVAVLGHRTGRLWSVPLCAAYSPDGKMLATGEEAGNPVITLWDAATLRRNAILPGHSLGVYQVAFSADGKTLASVERLPNMLRLWDLTGPRPRERAHFEASRKGPTWSVAFAPDAPLLAAADNTPDVRLWDVSRSPPVQVRTLPNPATAGGEPWGVSQVAFAGSGKALLTFDWYSTVRLWDLSGPRPRVAWAQRLEPMVNPLLALAPDGKVLALGRAMYFDVGGANSPPGYPARTPGWVKLWRVGAAGLKEWATLPANEVDHVDFVGQLSFTGDGRSLVCARNSGTYVIYDLTGAQPRVRFTFKDFPTPKDLDDYVPAPAFALSPDGRRLAAVGRPDQTLRVWDLSGDPPRQVFPDRLPDPWLYAHVRFAPDGRTLAAWMARRAPGVSAKGEMLLWDLAGRAPVQRAAFPLNDKGLIGMSFSPDSRTLLTCRDSEGHIVEFWDVGEGTPSSCRERVTMPGGDVCLKHAFSPTGGLLATAGTDTGHLWDLAGARPKHVATFKDKAERSLGSLAFSPDDKVLAAGSSGGDVCLWRLEGARPREVPAVRVGADLFTEGVFSHDGRSLACVGVPFGWDKVVVCFYDVAGKEPKLRRKVEWQTERPRWGGSSTRDAFTPDDRRLLLLLSNEVLVLDATSGKQLFRRRLVGRVVDADFAPDGRHLAAANGDGSVFILRLPTLTEKPPDK